MDFPDPSPLIDKMEGSSQGNQEVTEQSQSPQGTQDQVSSQTIYELEKLGKFKLEGREYTLDGLKKEMLREKDYTRKTQELAEQRKSYESKQHFEKNLPFDLHFVASKMNENPQVIQQFLKTYPAEYHSTLKNYLDYLGQNQTSEAKPTQSVQQKPSYDIDTMSRLERLEKSFSEQEVSKNESYINSKMDSLGKKYPDAMPDLVLARAVEIMDKGTKLSDDVWDQIYKQVDNQGKEFVKARYGDLVKRQKTANEKSRDVGSGGGIVGQAPKKFSKIEDIKNFAIQDLSSKSR